MDRRGRSKSAQFIGYKANNWASRNTVAEAKESQATWCFRMVQPEAYPSATLSAAQAQNLNTTPQN